MKLRILCALLVLSVAGAASADTHITFEKHVEGWYSNGVNHPEQTSVYHMWIGKGKLAYITDTASVLINTNDKTMAVAFPGSRTYAQTSLPMKWATLVPAEILPFIEKYPLTGTISKGKERKKIGKWPCRRYRADAWIDYQGSRVNETAATMWVTTKVPFNWKKLPGLIRDLRKWGNYSDDLIAQYATVKGFAVRTEIEHFSHGFTYAETHAVKSINKEKPPAGLYSVPEGFTKKDQLTIQDLQED